MISEALTFGIWGTLYFVEQADLKYQLWISSAFIDIMGALKKCIFRMLFVLSWPFRASEIEWLVNWKNRTRQ